MKPILSRRDFLFACDRAKFYPSIPFPTKTIKQTLRNDRLADFLCYCATGKITMPYHKLKKGQTAYILYPRRSFAGLIVAHMRRITVSRIVIDANEWTGIYQTIEAQVSSGCVAQYCAQFCFASVAEAVNETCKSFIPEEKRAAMIRDFEAHFAEIPINENAETTHTVVVEDLDA